MPPRPPPIVARFSSVSARGSQAVAADDQRTAIDAGRARAGAPFIITEALRPGRDPHRRLDRRRRLVEPRSHRRRRARCSVAGRAGPGARRCGCVVLTDRSPGSGAGATTAAWVEGWFGGRRNPLADASDAFKTLGTTLLLDLPAGALDGAADGVAHLLGRRLRKIAQSLTGHCPHSRTHRYCRWCRFHPTMRCSSARE